MIQTQTRTLWAVILTEPLDLVRAQPHQALISTASVALMAQFAASGGIVHPIVGYLLAIGVEWAYLRGLASDSRATTEWGSRLNWSAFTIVVLWGCLWCLRTFGVIAERPQGPAAILLALSHVVPIAWLSLCSAMCHRAAVQLEAAYQLEYERAERERMIEAERLSQERQGEIEAAERAERLKFELWEKAQRVKAELKATSEVPKKIGTQPFATGTKVCRHCGTEVEYSTPSEAGVIARRGCPECRAKKRVVSA